MRYIVLLAVVAVPIGLFFVPGWSSRTHDVAVEPASSDPAAEALPASSETPAVPPMPDPATQPEMPAAGGVPILLRVVAVAETSVDVVVVEPRLEGEKPEVLTYQWADLKVSRASGSGIPADKVAGLVRIGQPIVWVDDPEKLDRVWREALSDRTLLISPLQP